LNADYRHRARDRRNERQAGARARLLLADEILWDHRFVDVFCWTEDGRRVIDYRRFHDTVPLSAAR